MPHATEPWEIRSCDAAFCGFEIAGKQLLTAKILGILPAYDRGNPGSPALSI